MANYTNNWSNQFKRDRKLGKNKKIFVVGKCKLSRKK